MRDLGEKHSCSFHKHTKLALPFIEMYFHFLLTPDTFHNLPEVYPYPLKISVFRKTYHKLEI